jgi:hypothetical protein
MAQPIKKNMKDFWMLKSPLLLKQKMDYVLSERIKRGTSDIEDIRNRSLCYKRLALAIGREPTIWEKLIMSELAEEDVKPVSGLGRKKK